MAESKRRRTIRRLIVLTGLILALLAPAAPAFAVNDPVGYWKLDGDALDYSSGGSNDGTLQGGPVYVSGKFGNGLDFDGNGDYIEILAAPELRPANITFAAWFRSRGLTGQAQLFLSRSKASWTAFHLEISNSGDVGAHVGTDSASANGPYVWTSGTNYADDTWHHAAGTYDGTTLKFYFDGQFIGSDTTNNGAIVYEDNDANHQNTHVGAHAFFGPTVDNEFDGVLDDVRIYDRALSAAENQLLYAAKCLDPIGDEAKIIYNTTANVPQVCNGEEWLAMGAINPAAGGSGCTGPVAPEGKIIYNTTHHVLQYCDGDDWKSAHGFEKEVSGCAAPSSCPNVGDVCDGSVYAGLSPDGNVPMYTTPADLGGMPWNNGNTSGYVYTNVTNSVAGEANTANLITVDSDSNTGGTQPHQAAQACADLIAHGHTDWYLPSRAELSVLWNNEFAIGGFNTSGSFPAGSYWASQEPNSSQAWSKRFSDNLDSGTNKYSGVSVRCVRRD